MNSLARLDADQDRLEPIPGQPPSMLSPPPAAPSIRAAPCRRAALRCRTEVPELRDFGDHVAACHFAEELAAQRVVAGTPGGGS